jgi:hypothetical protein
MFYRLKLIQKYYLQSQIQKYQNKSEDLKYINKTTIIIMDTYKIKSPERRTHFLKRRN